MLMLKMAWKNLWRNRNRTLITMASVFFAVILSIFTSALKTGIFDNLVKNMVSFYSGYIQIHSNGYWDEQILDNSFPDNGSIENKLRKDPTIISYTARLESFALASATTLTKGCMIVGVIPDNENKVTSLQKKLIQGDYLTHNDHAVLLSAGLLQRLNLKLHDTVVLIGQGFHGTTAAGQYRIKGVLKFGSPDLNDQTLYMSLAAAQDLLGAPNRISAIVLGIKKIESLHEIDLNLERSLGSNYEVMTWEEMMPDIYQHIHADSKNMYYVQTVLYLLICFGIFGTLLMMMAERHFECGMLIAIGMQKARLAWMLFFETILLVTLGCLLGLLFSVPVVYYFHIHPMKMSGEVSAIYERFGFEAIFPTSIDSEIFLNQAGIVLLMGCLMAFYPVIKIIRLNAVEAMRK